MSEERLNCDTINTQPVEYEWGAEICDIDGDDEGWAIVYPDPDHWTDEQCVEYASDEGIEDDDHDDMREVIREHLLENPDEPMMSYYYPLPRSEERDPGELQAILAVQAGPVVCVLVNGRPVLALSGGGMDLSWEICEAFIVLGYCPPAHFCDLPAMAGRGESERDKRIVRACVNSLEVQARWAMRPVEELKRRYLS